MSPIGRTFCVDDGTLRHNGPCRAERQADKDLYLGLKRGEFALAFRWERKRKLSIPPEADPSLPGFSSRPPFLKESLTHLIFVDEPNSVTMIAKYPVGRVLLHLICLARHPAHLKWHLRGIGREIGVHAHATTL